MNINHLSQSGVLLVFKPSGLPTTHGQTSPCLVEEILSKYPNQTNVGGFQKGEGGLLYRLDNQTSGLVLFAENNRTFEQFTNDSHLLQVKKHYLAYVLGHVASDQGVISFPIAHHPRSQKKMIAMIEKNQKKRSEWRDADTYYRVLSRDQQGNSWLHLMIYQGARHQIRVHCAALGHPLVGDYLYNQRADETEPMLLRCQSVEWLSQKLLFSLTDLPLTDEEKGSFPELTTLTIG